MRKNSPSFDLWSEAHFEASEAELRVQQAAMLFAYGKGIAPAEHLIAEALTKRVRALALFETMLNDHRRLALDVQAPRSQRQHRLDDPAAA